MTRNLKIFSGLFVVLLVTSCWQKQAHEITGPEIPRYILDGTTIDYDTGKLLPGTKLKIQPAQLLYDVSFNSIMVESDSNGHFTVDPVYPGDYNLTVNTDDSWHSIQKIGIEHADRNLTVRVPKTINAKILLKKFTGSISNEFYYPMENAAFAVSGSKLLINCNRVRESITNPAIGIFYVQWNNWYFEKPFTPSINYNKLRNMTVGTDKIYISTKDDSILTLNRWTGYPEGIKKAPVNVFGLAFNSKDKNMYACSHSEIYKLDPVDYSLINTYPAPSEYLNAMAFNNNIYTYDNIEYLLRVHDENMNVLSTFAIIDPVSRYQIESIYDFDFDAFNNLWIMIN